jgi:hypothetical protein
LLDLIAVLQLLAKDAVVVAQAVADRWDLQSRHRVDEAGGQPAKPAISEACVRFFFDELRQPK